ncbi:MAG: ribonuclease D [Armatimonadota bacterium]
MLITSNHDLSLFCDRARDAGVVYLDTEFVTEESYLPRLEIIQMEVEGQIVIVDYQSLGSSDSLWGLLYDAHIEKVFHAAKQDLSIFYQQSGQPMTNIFDTQIAAAFVGIGEQISYAELVRTVTGVGLSKSHTYSDWGRRPLSDAQIAYAQDDVKYLPQITAHLKKQLADLGRTDWAVEEFREMEQITSTDPSASEDLYLRVKGMSALRPKELAILRELAIWRDQEAMHRNRPIGRVLKDEQIVNLVRHAPQSLEELRDVRGFPEHLANQLGRGILDAVGAGLATPKEQWPSRPEGRYVSPGQQATVALMQALIRLRAMEEQSAGRLLSNSSELEELAMRAPNIDPQDFRVLRGWRYEMIGHDLLRLLKGEIGLTVDPETGRAIPIEISPP